MIIKCLRQPERVNCQECSTALSLQRLHGNIKNSCSTWFIPYTVYTPRSWYSAHSSCLWSFPWESFCNLIFISPHSLLDLSFERVFELRHLIVQLLLLLAVLVIHFHFICCAARASVTFTLLWPSPVRLPNCSCSSCCCCRGSWSCSRVPRWVGSSIVCAAL